MNFDIETHGKSLVQSIREYQQRAITAQMQSGIRGIEVNAVWFDEAKDHTSDAISYMLQSQPVWEPRIKPEHLHCRQCQAEPGQPCRRWSNRHQEFCRKKTSAHGVRKKDARRGNIMLDALKPR